MHDFVATCTIDDLTPLIGETFSLETGGDVMQVRLDSTKPSSVGMIRDIPVFIDGVELPPRVSFSVVFKGPEDIGFEQSLCTLSHAATGDMVLMLSYIGPEPGARLYEAVFA